MDPIAPTITEAPAEKPKRKPARRRAPQRAAAPPEKRDEFAGLTANDCCLDCAAERCVITRIGVCGHPFKASHPTLGHDVQNRIAAAKKKIGHQKIEMRG